MFKNVVRLEFKVVDRIYHFTCDPDSPIEHIKEVLFQCQKYIGAVEDQVKAQMEQNQAKEQHDANVENSEEKSNQPSEV